MFFARLDQLSRHKSSRNKPCRFKIQFQKKTPYPLSLKVFDLNNLLPIVVLKYLFRTPRSGNVLKKKCYWHYGTDPRLFYGSNAHQDFFPILNEFLKSIICHCLRSLSTINVSFFVKSKSVSQVLIRAMV